MSRASRQDTGLKRHSPREPAALKEEVVALWEVMVAQSTFAVDGETEAQRGEPVCQVISRHRQLTVLREHNVLVAP